MNKVLSISPTAFRKRNGSATLSNDQVAIHKLGIILKEWDIDPELWDEILEGLSLIAIDTPNKGLTTRLTSDQRERVTLIIKCDDALQSLFIQEKHRKEWIHNQHKSLDGHSPLDVMTCGSLIALHELNRYVQGLIRS